MQVAIKSLGRAGFTLADPLLGVVFSRPGEGNRATIGTQGDFAQVKITLRSLVIGASGTILGQALVWQGLQPESRNAFLIRLKFQTIKIMLGLVAFGQDGTISQHTQPRQVGTQLNRLQHAPRHCLGRLGLEPLGKLFLETRTLQCARRFPLTRLDALG